MIIRRCPKCKRDFYRYASTYCKLCTCKYARERQKRPRIYARTSARLRNARLRALISYGGKCACCGVTDPMFLDFDHTNGGGSKERKNIEPRKFYLWLIDKHRDDIQILCCNCNCGRYRNGGICPHTSGLLSATERLRANENFLSDKIITKSPIPWSAVTEVADAR